MTYVGGIEALHSFTRPGETEPAITLGKGLFRLLEITGLGSIGEVELNSDARVGAIGENIRPSDERGKSLAYVGRIMATSLLELREAEAELRGALAGWRREGRIDIAPHPDNVELAGQAPKFYEAKVVSCDVIDKQATKSWNRNFVIGLRMGDPRVFEEGDEAYAAEITETTVSGEGQEEFT